MVTQQGMGVQMLVLGARNTHFKQIPNIRYVLEV